MKNMFDSNKLMQRFLRPVKNAVWDLTTGKIGIQSEEGIITIEGEGMNASVVINMIDQFGMPVPAFAQNTPKESVKIGDFIYNNSKPLGWVTRLPDATHSTFGIITVNGTSNNWNPPKVSMLGMNDGVMVLRSLINMLPGGSDGLNGLTGMLMPMMMMSGGSIDLEKIMPIMIMSQMGNSVQSTVDENGNTIQNPMSGMNNMLMPMMMMQMMNKNNKSGHSGAVSFFD